MKSRQGIRAPSGYLVVLVLLAGTAGCETYSAPNIQEPYEAIGVRELHVEACHDRTGLQGGRDLGQEGTEALRDKLRASTAFDVRDEAPLMVSCEIEKYIAGSAIKRWLLPGWGATKAMVKVGVWRLPEEILVATFQSKAQVTAGGLYTIGAEDYIVDVAMGDIVKQMESWAQGTPAEGGD